MPFLPFVPLGVKCWTVAQTVRRATRPFRPSFRPRLPRPRVRHFAAIATPAAIAVPKSPALGGLVCVMLGGQPGLPPVAGFIPPPYTDTAYAANPLPAGSVFGGYGGPVGGFGGSPLGGFFGGGGSAFGPSGPILADLGSPPFGGVLPPSPFPPPIDVLPPGHGGGGPGTPGGPPGEGNPPPGGPHGPTPVPEPAALALFLTGLLGLAWTQRRRISG